MRTQPSSMVTYLTLASFLGAYWLMGELFATYRRAVLAEDAEDARKPAARKRHHMGLIWFTLADLLYLVVAVWFVAGNTDGWRLRVCLVLSPVGYANCLRFCSRLALLYRDRRSTMRHDHRDAKRRTLTADALLSEINAVQSAGLLLLGLVTLMPALGAGFPGVEQFPSDASLFRFFAYSLLPCATALVLIVPTLLRLRRESQISTNA